MPVLTFSLSLCHLRLIQQIQLNDEIFPLHIVVCHVVSLVKKKDDY